MDEKLVDYLNLPVCSESFKEIISDLIKSKHSLVAIIFNHILQNLELEYLEDYEEFKKIKSLRMITVRKEGDPVLSFLPIGKEPSYTSKGTWSKTNRQDGKIGRVIEHLLLLICI